MSMGNPGVSKTMPTGERERRESVTSAGRRSTLYFECNDHDLVSLYSYRSDSRWKNKTSNVHLYDTNLMRVAAAAAVFL